MKSNKTPLERFLFGMLCLVESAHRQTGILLVLVFVFASVTSSAQVIWGAAERPRLIESGIIFRVNANGTDYLEIPFEGGGSNNGQFPSYTNQNHLVKASNGKFYGITIAGGVEGDGTFFEFDPATGKRTTKINFYYYDQGRPVGDLLEYNGKLYGSIGGMQNGIFSYDPATSVYKREYNLPMRCTGLIMVDGKFYGMTVNGGLKWAGAIFEINPVTSVYKVLAQFDHNLTGRYPENGLTYANGKLYGLTNSGGKYGKGTLIEYDLALQQFKKKFDFKVEVNGGAPVGELVYHNGKLLGIATGGGVYGRGTVFEFDPVTDIMNKVFDFSDTTPMGVIQKTGEKIMGISTTGGVGGQGFLFSFNPESREHKIEMEFVSPASGTNPFGRLTLDGNKLWGMTMNGGLGNGGVIFGFDVVTQHYTTESSFNYFPNGKNPSCLVEFNDKFYGISPDGGDFNHGALFEFDPGTLTFSALHSFGCDECSSDPYAPVVSGGKLLVVGNTLYGVVAKSGADTEGEFFKYDVNVQQYTNLRSFTSLETGILPRGNIVELNGKIYGTTLQGGSNNQGILYAFDPATSDFQTKLSLVDPVGNVNPTSSYMNFTSANNLLYWVAASGSFGTGILNAYNPDDNTITTKYEFQNSNDGIYPGGNLVSRSSKLYGVTRRGGAFNVGAIFEYDIDANLYTKIHDAAYWENSIDNMVIVENKIYGIIDTPADLIEFNLDNATLTTLSPLAFGYDNSTVRSLIVKPDTAVCKLIATTSEVVEFLQGKRKDGGVISMERSNPQNALFSEDANDSPSGGIKFVSLGFGGSITLAFDHPLCDKEGNDLYIYETSFGNPSFYDLPEQAEVFVSKDGSSWASLGLTNPLLPDQECKTKLDSDFDIQPSGLDWIKYVKVVDVSKRLAKRRNKDNCVESAFLAFNNAADGFDLDAIEVINTTGQSGVTARYAQRNNNTTINIDASHSKATLFPNPVSNSLVIDMSEEEEMAMTDDGLVLEIIDMQGKVLERTVDALDESWRVTHDVSSLNNGVFIARVSSGNVRWHYKFLKK